MSKKILFNSEAKEALKKGVNIVAEAVGSTLGAAGKTVIVSNFHSVPPFVTKDGVSVATTILLEDEIENIGAMMMRNASTQTLKDAGDGTTTTVVLAQSILNEGLKQVSAGANPQEVKSGIDKAVNKVVETLNLISEKVGDNNERIKNIATVSANNDTVIGGLIAEAYSKIGSDGLLLIEESGTIETQIEVVEGVEISRGYMSPDFVTNKDKMTASYDNPLFLIADYTISTMKDLAPIFIQLDKGGMLHRGVIIVAQDFEGEAFSTMRMNHMQGRIKCCLMKAPSSYRRETLEDIATVTGATVIKDEAGLKMENTKIEHLGEAAKVIISEHKATIVGGNGKEAEIKELKHAIKVQMEEMKDEKLKDVWKKRLAGISGSIGVIKVGGATDVEVKEKKDRVDDACRAVKSAIEEGVVVGGGVALLRCVDSLKEIEVFGDEKIGVDIILKACKAPLIKMLENAGEDSSIVKEVMSFKNAKPTISSGQPLPKELTDLLDTKAINNYGYNIKTKQFQDLFENGVIDPTKVVRCALQNAASVSCAVITSDCLIVEMKAKN